MFGVVSLSPCVLPKQPAVKAGPIKVGDIVTPKSTSGKQDIPRMPGDTLYSMEAGTQLEIVRKVRGGYDGKTNSNAEFVHRILGFSRYYEVKVLGNSTVYDNYAGRFLTHNSLVYLPINTVNERFNVVNKA